MGILYAKLFAERFTLHVSQKGLFIISIHHFASKLLNTITSSRFISKQGVVNLFDFFSTTAVYVHIRNKLPEQPLSSFGDFNSAALNQHSNSNTFLFIKYITGICITLEETTNSNDPAYISNNEKKNYK